MDLKTKKRIAARILKCGIDKVWMDPERLGEIKESITRRDVRNLISQGIIQNVHEVGTSKSRSRIRKLQRKKGRQKGAGSKQGTRHARLSKKQRWIARIRIQRRFLKHLRDKGAINKKTYHLFYKKSKGGFFRSKRHIKVYIEEHGLIKK